VAAGNSVFGLTVWSGFSALSLSLCTFACVRWGQPKDMAAPIVFLLAYSAPYIVARGPLPSGITFLLVTYAALVLVFYELEMNAVAHSYAVAIGLCLLAVSGALPFATGQGFAHNFWNYLALLNHGQNALVGVTVYAARNYR
jgi:hypothetical protein